jgi:hypothetical protein
MAKGRKTGGRRPGSRNKATAAKAAAIARSGLTPLDYMLSIMRSESQPSDIRLDAAKSAAPYVHPKLAAIEHTGKGGEPLIPEANVTEREVAHRLAFLLSRAQHTLEQKTPEAK